MEINNQIKIEFGVMSCKYEMEASSLLIGKIAMTLFFEKPVPIAIYSHKESSFMPDVKFLKDNLNVDNTEVKTAFDSIKKIK